MPNPPIRPTRNIGGVPHEWDGRTWVPAGGGGDRPPMMPMINLPPGTPQSPEGVARNSEILKQFLTGAGGIAGGLMFGIPGAVLGGAAGRSLGHAPEAALGIPNDSSFAGDATIGAGEGLVNEVAPMAIRPLVKGTGTGLRMLGRAALDNPNAGYRARAMVGYLRGLAASRFGGPTADAVAGLGPMVASEVGTRLENSAAKIPSRTLSEWAGGAYNALAERLGLAEKAAPELTHAERLAAGADTAAAARPSATGVRVNRVRGFTGADPAEAVPWEGPVQPAPGGWRADIPKRPDLRPAVRANPRAVALEPPAAVPSGAAPDVTVNPRGSVGPREYPPSGAAPDVTYDPRGNVGPREYPPAAAAADVTVNPRGNVGPREYPPSGAAPDVTVDPRGGVGVRTPATADVTVNPKAYARPAEDPAWLDQYALGPEDYKTPGPVDVLKEQAQTGMPANLTADELASYYDANQPGFAPPPAPAAAPSAVDALKRSTMPANAVPDDPAAAFAQKYGTPSDADVAESITGKNLKYAADKAKKTAPFLGGVGSLDALARRIPETRQAELLDKFGGTLGKAERPEPIDVGLEGTSLDALAKRLGFVPPIK